MLWYDNRRCVYLIHEDMRFFLKKKRNCLSIKIYVKYLTPDGH